MSARNTATATATTTAPPPADSPAGGDVPSAGSASGGASGWAGVVPRGLAAPFSGSYQPEDVLFLLKPVEMAPTAVEEKEQLIQSGRRHYSEMLAPESVPDADYMTLFRKAFAANRARMAIDLVALAQALDRRYAGRPEIVLVSLARAGTPVGVLLRRALLRLGRQAPHYSLSIIRDRGIDAVALDHILAHHAPEDIAIIDGWTGKGAITGELERSLGLYKDQRGIDLAPDLHVLADLAGVATLAATTEDYLIPSSILNAIISGLVSRTVLNDTHVGPEDFHACVMYRALAEQDLSDWFITELDADVEVVLHTPPPPAEHPLEARQALRRSCLAFVEDTLQRYNAADRNRIKPGIGEATRSLLRRVPERLLLKDPEEEAVAPLVWLAERRGVTMEHRPDLPSPYRAAAIIRTLGQG